MTTKAPAKRTNKKGCVEKSMLRNADLCHLLAHLPDSNNEDSDLAHALVAMYTESLSLDTMSSGSGEHLGGIKLHQGDFFCYLYYRAASGSIILPRCAMTSWLRELSTMHGSTVSPRDVTWYQFGRFRKVGDCLSVFNSLNLLSSSETVCARLALKAKSSFAPQSVLQRCGIPTSYAGRMHVVLYRWAVCLASCMLRVAPTFSCGGSLLNQPGQHPPSSQRNILTCL